jgi:hypothetical protein
VCWLLWHKLGIKSSHYPKGISILAIPEIKFATYFLTTDYGVAKVPRIEYFIYDFKIGSIFIQKSSNLSIFYLLRMKFLNTNAAICLDWLSKFSFVISRVNVTRNFNGS